MFIGIYILNHYFMTYKTLLNYNHIFMVDFKPIIEIICVNCICLKLSLNLLFLTIKRYLRFVENKTKLTIKKNTYLYLCSKLMLQDEPNQRYYLYQLLTHT